MQTTPSQIFTRADLVIRPALPEDRAPLEAIAAQIWEGSDYLPRVMDEWFNDPYGGFFVVTLRNRVIGTGKITRLAEGEWWLEGLRIDPAYRGHGFSRILHHFLLNQVRQMGSGTIRFSTASVNEIVQHLAQETAFSLVARYLPYGADALDEPVQSVWRLDPDDAPRVRVWLNQSAHYVHAQRSLEWDWIYMLLTDDRLAERLAEELVYGWPQQGRRDTLGGVIIVNPSDKACWPGDPTLKIAYFDTAPGDLTAAAQDMRRLAAALERVHVRIKVLDQPGRATAFEAAGYTREWEGEAWLYTRDVSLTMRAAVRTDSASGN